MMAPVAKGSVPLTDTLRIGAIRETGRHSWKGPILLVEQGFHGGQCSVGGPSIATLNVSTVSCHQGQATPCSCLDHCRGLLAAPQAGIPPRHILLEHCGVFGHPGGKSPVIGWGLVRPRPLAPLIVSPMCLSSALLPPPSSGVLPAATLGLYVLFPPPGTLLHKFFCAAHHSTLLQCCFLPIPQPKGPPQTF